MLPIYPAEKKADLIKRLQTRLRYHGFTNLVIDGNYGRQTLFAVRAFQSAYLSPSGEVLNVDGIINQPTWESLLMKHPTIKNTPSPLQLQALRFARIELGILELPLRSNNGPRVSQYLDSVSCPVGQPWCAAFVYWCFQKAANEICTINPLTYTGHCHTHFNHTQGQRITPEMASQNPALIKPGTIFIIDHGNGKGHTGIISSIEHATTSTESLILTTIEGNTNTTRSREGIGVFQHIRTLPEITLGFINYG